MQLVDCSNIGLHEGYKFIRFNISLHGTVTIADDQGVCLLVVALINGRGTFLSGKGC